MEDWMIQYDAPPVEQPDPPSEEGGANESDAKK